MLNELAHRLAGAQRFNVTCSGTLAGVLGSQDPFQVQVPCWVDNKQLLWEVMEAAR